MLYVRLNLKIFILARVPPCLGDSMACADELRMTAEIIGRNVEHERTRGFSLFCVHFSLIRAGLFVSPYL